MDTIAVQTEVDRPTWDRIARQLRQRSVRGTDGRESRKAYGSFYFSRPTLYLSQAATFPTCRVVLEFCPGKAVRGHNVYASELCARAAMDLVLDEVEGVTGACLHDYTFLVCRFDVAHTFIGVAAAPYLTEAAKFGLVRRERVVYEHGVGYKAKSRSELIYDKRAEVHHALEKLRGTGAEDDDAKDLAELVALIPSPAGVGPGHVEEAHGLLEAARLVANGALRVECRIKGSPNISRALDLLIPGSTPAAYHPATFDRVVRDENTYRVLGAFLAQFDFGGSVAGPDTIGRLRDAGHTGSRLLQLLGFRELEKAVGADRAAYQALGLPVSRRRSLRRDLHTSGVRRLGEPSLSPLVVTRDDLAEIRKKDEGDTETWQARRTDWANYWGLRSHGLALLAG